jgi:hypothetical protein
MSIVCCRPLDCLVIRPFGDDCVSPLIYGSDDQFDIIRRVLSIIIPNQAVFHDGQFTIAGFLSLNENIEKYANKGLVEMSFNGHAMFTPSIRKCSTISLK